MGYNPTGSYGFRLPQKGTKGAWISAFSLQPSAFDSAPRPVTILPSAISQLTLFLIKFGERRIQPQSEFNICSFEESLNYLKFECQPHETRGSLEPVSVNGQLAYFCNPAKPGEQLRGGLDFQRILPQPHHYQRR